jgi:predicted transposase/invertase (TIGR01784 family)
MGACPNDNGVMESMETTETMDTEIHDVREELRRFYGKRKFAQMEEDLKQKVEAEVEAEQKRKTKQECKKAFKAGEERTTISVVTRMFNNGFTVKSIMSICDLSEQDVIAIRDHGCLPQH